MFTLRGVAVALNGFVLLYCLLSALVATAWRPLKPLHVAKQSVAAILFALRALPLAASVIITFALVVPSFQLLERRSIDEGVGAMPVALGIFALLLIACAVSLRNRGSNQDDTAGGSLAGRRAAFERRSRRLRHFSVPRGKLPHSFWSASGIRRC